MPIYQPKMDSVSLDDQQNASSIIKKGIREAVISEKKEPKGVWLLFLPPWNAEGRWYKMLTIRDNFGEKIKEKYVVIENDPVSYFVKNYQYRHPNEPKSWQEEEGGKKYTRYPYYGRQTKRVLYNVAYYQRMGDGCHVLNVPVYKCADVIDKYCRTEHPITKAVNGPICDPNRCVPVFMKVDGMNYTVTLMPDQPVQLPEQFADSQYLYNLDEVYIKKTPEELIAKLHEMYHPEEVDACLDGYPGYKKVVATGFAAANPMAGAMPPAVVLSAPVQPLPAATIPTAQAPAPAVPPPVAIAKPSLPPVASIPTANPVPVAPAVAQITPPIIGNQLPSNPVPSVPAMNEAEMARFLREGQ